MKYPPALLDDIRARLPCSQVVGRKVALKKAGREWRGLSPFKTEKSPSFYVNDQKGFYHCFASGEHGDIFTFLMKTEGLTFPEAIERLAEEAGVPLPKGEARNPEREDERKRLYDLMEASAKFFEAAYQGPNAAHARTYVADKRGLTPATVQRFRLGFAPDGRNVLKQHLAKLGFSNDDMIASGMLIGGADIPVSYDRFRNRVMFPITDMKGKIIAFGGRALEAGVPAKYLNSPETPLFHKGHILFNAANARSAAHDKNRIIAVEGYMDVVALASAGFNESVAPLGTALTEDQTKLLWRLAAEPILCFDGDSAGRKAAFRAVDTALPHLVPGKSIRFAFLPDGLDPDDLIRQQGAAAMEAILGATRSLADVLYDREWASGDWTTPERRAQFEKQLFTLVGRIQDAQVRGYYAEDMRNRMNHAFGRTAQLAPPPSPPIPDFGSNGHDDPGFDVEAYGYDNRADPGDAVPLVPWQGRAPGGSRKGSDFQPGRGFQKDAKPKDPFAGKPWQARFPGMAGGGKGRNWKPPELLDNKLAAGDSLKENVKIERGIPPHEAQVLRAVINHPWLLDTGWEHLAGLEFASSAAKRLRDTLLTLPVDPSPLDSGQLRAQLTLLGVEDTLLDLDSAATHKSDRFAEPGAERDVVDNGWKHAAIMRRREGYRAALIAAEQAWMDDPSEEVYERIAELKRLQNEPVEMDDPVGS
jgi:DNA primase